MSPRIFAWPFFVATSLGAGGVAADTTTPRPARFVVEMAGARVEADEATVASEKLGEHDPLVQKPGPGKPDEIALRGGAAMARDIAKLLDEAFAKDCARRVDGSFVFADKELSELSRVTFSWAVITDVGLPALDGASKDAASMTLKIQPQFPRRILQAGEKLGRTPAAPAWLRSSFKLSIEGLESALKSVVQVGEVHVTQTPSSSAPVVCAAPTIADLTFALPTADAAGLAAWKDSAGRSGSLEYLAADGSSVLKIKLSGLKKKSQSADGPLTRVTASVASVAFDPNGKAAAPTAPAKK